jgi:polysaccharide deacetylase family protein (PEP-CTERM system associated)
MIHALTIDLEDYRSIVARDYFGREVPPDAIVVENTERLLGWFAERDVRATFFALGDVVESYPQLIRDIASAGHELGVHGHHHRQVFKLTPESFRREVEIPKQMIEDLIGGPVRGHRAPAFSIMPKTAWALDILAELGFRYDSSIMPIHGRRYGWPGYPLDIHTHRLNDRRPLVEAPLSTVRLMGRQVPVGGGGYLRHFPLSFTRWGLRRIQRRRPFIVYLHPCEVQTRPDSFPFESLPGEIRRRGRRFHHLQVRNRDTIETKLKGLIDEFQFAPLASVIDSILGTEWRA